MVAEAAEGGHGKLKLAPPMAQFHFNRGDGDGPIHL
jgi:hypothetical protein